MKKSIKCMALALVLAISMIPAFAFAAMATRPVIDEVEHPLYVEYDCNLNDNDIERVYWVESMFNIPTVVLTNREANEKYTWNKDLGKYTVVVEEDARQDLDEDSNFTVQILNKSNLPVSYNLAYITNDCMFKSNSASVKLNGGDETSILNSFDELIGNYISGSLDTVAQGQSVSGGIITIEDSDAATTAPDEGWMESTDYKATLEGTVNVTLDDATYDGSDLLIDRKTGMKTAVAGNFNLRLYGEPVVAQAR